MLAIKGAMTKEGREIAHWHIWHIGDPSLEMTRVVVFQADGDELYLFQQAMALARKPRNGIWYSKEKGFHVVEGEVHRGEVDTADGE